MKKAKKLIGLFLAVVLVFSTVYTPALAANSTSYTPATPAQYDFRIDGGESTPLWAYEIEGAVYFNLRDLAMVLNGTDKQFEVSWDGSKNAISLTTGTAYTPVGGELSEPLELSDPCYDKGAVAYSPTTLFYVDNRQVPIRAYIINGAHYIMLYDLAANLMFSAQCYVEENLADIITTEYYTELCSFSLPNGWRASGDPYNLNLSFSRSDETVGSLVLRNYDPDKPISQFVDNHRTIVSSESLSNFMPLKGEPGYPAAKAIIRATQPAAANDDSYVDELHLYIMLPDLRCAFDLCFDSAKVDEQTAIEIAKRFSPSDKAIEKNSVAAEWALAIQNRDGRAQYELMNEELQADYYDYYDSRNWETGVSSPWVNSWIIELSKGQAVVFYKNETSTGFAGYTIDTLTFSEENGQLKISGIDGYHAQFVATGSSAGDVAPEIFK